MADFTPMFEPMQQRPMLNRGQPNPYSYQRQFGPAEADLDALLQQWMAMAQPKLDKYGKPLVAGAVQNPAVNKFMSTPLQKPVQDLLLNPGVNEFMKQPLTNAMPSFPPAPAPGTEPSIGMPPPPAPDPEMWKALIRAQQQPTLPPHRSGGASSVTLPLPSDPNMPAPTPGPETVLPGYKDVFKGTGSSLWDTITSALAGSPGGLNIGASSAQIPPGMLQVPPEKPEPPAAAATPREAMAEPVKGSSMLDQWKALFNGVGASGGGGSAGIPIPARRSYPSAPPPELEGPTRPDYTKADEYLGKAAPKEREGVDINLAMLAGLARGFNPRPGESFGMTLGRMAGPGLEEYTRATEKNKDRKGEFEDRQAAYNATLGNVHSGRAGEEARIGDAGKRTTFENKQAQWKNLIDKENFEGTQDERQFQRGATNRQLDISERSAKAHEATSRAPFLIHHHSH